MLKIGIKNTKTDKNKDNFSNHLQLNNVLHFLC